MRRLTALLVVSFVLASANAENVVGVPAGGQESVTMESGQTYIVQQCGGGGQLSLVAQNPNNASVAKDWIVVIDVPAMDVAGCNMIVDGTTDGNNGTLVALMTGGAEAVLHNDYNGRAQLGAMSVSLFHVSHIQLETSPPQAGQPASAIQVVGIPCTADLVITAPSTGPPAVVSLGSLGNNVLLVNAVSTITASVLQQLHTTVAASGPMAKIAVPLSSAGASSGRLKAGCLTFPGQPEGIVASAWFGAAMAGHGFVSHQVGGVASCKALFGGATTALATGRVAVTVPQLSVSDLTGTVRHLSVDDAASVTLTGASSSLLQDVSLVRDVLTTPDYSLAVSAKAGLPSAIVSASLFWAASPVVGVNCTAWSPSTQPTEWRFVRSDGDPSGDTVSLPPQTVVSWGVNNACRGLMQNLDPMPALKLLIDGHDSPSFQDNPPAVNITAADPQPHGPPPARKVYTTPGGVRMLSSTLQPVVVTWASAKADQERESTTTSTARVKVRLSVSGGASSVSVAAEPAPTTFRRLVHQPGPAAAALSVDATSLPVATTVTNGYGTMDVEPVGPLLPYLPHIRVAYAAVPTARVYTPAVGATVLELGSPGTEVAYSFPAELPTAGSVLVNNSAVIASAPAPLLLSGRVVSVEVAPPSSLGAPVAIVGSQARTQLKVIPPTDACGQHLRVGTHGVAQVDSAGMPVPCAVPAPSAWLCGLWAASGLPTQTCNSNKTLVVDPTWVQLDLHTGPGADSVVYTALGLDTRMRLGAGSDVVNGSVVTANVFEVDLGVGSDTFQHAGSLVVANVSLGNDDDPDRATFVAGADGLDVLGVVLSPFGVAGAANYATLQFWRSADQVSVFPGAKQLTNGPPAMTRTVDMTVVGSTLAVQPADHVVYSVAGAESGASVQFDDSISVGAPTAPVGSDWVVVLEPSLYSSQVPPPSFLLAASAGTNVTMLTKLGGAALALDVQSSGHALVAGCPVSFRGVAHVAVETLTAGAAIVLAQNSLGGADFYSGPHAHTVDIAGAGLAQNAVFVNGAVNMQPEAAVQGVLAIVLGSSARLSVVADGGVVPTTFVGGCLGTSMAPAVAPPLSAYLRARLAHNGYGHVHMPRYCRAVVHGAAAVSISTGTLVCGVLAPATRALDVTASSVVVNNTNGDWSSVYLQPSSTVLPGGTSLTVSSPSASRATVHLPTAAANGLNLTVNCPKGDPSSAFPHPQWLVGRDSNSTVNWSLEHSCAGTLFALPSAHTNMSLVPTAGVDSHQLAGLSVDVRLQSPGTHAVREVVVAAAADARSCGVHVASQTNASTAGSVNGDLSVTWPSRGQPVLSLALLDGANRVAVLGSQPLAAPPRLWFADAAQYHLSVPRGTVEVPGQVWLLPSTQQIVVPAPGFSAQLPDACLHGRQCSPASWEIALQIGGQGCSPRVEEERCRQHMVVQIASRIAHAHCSSSGVADTTFGAAGVELIEGDALAPDVPALRLQGDLVWGLEVAAFVLLVASLWLVSEAQWENTSRPQLLPNQRVPSSPSGRAFERLLHGFHDMYLPFLCLSALMYTLGDHVELEGIAAVAGKYARDLGTGRSCGVGEAAESAADWITMFAVGGGCFIVAVSTMTVQWFANPAAVSCCGRKPSRAMRTRSGHQRVRMNSDSDDDTGSDDDADTTQLPLFDGPVGGNGGMTLNAADMEDFPRADPSLVEMHCERDEAYSCRGSVAMCLTRFRACGRRHTISERSADTLRRVLGFSVLWATLPFVASHAIVSMSSAIALAGVVSVLACLLPDSWPYTLYVLLTTTGLGVASRLDLQASSRDPLVPLIAVAVVVVGDTFRTGWRLASWSVGREEPSMRGLPTWAFVLANTGIWTVWTVRMAASFVFAARIKWEFLSDTHFARPVVLFYVWVAASFMGVVHVAWYTANDLRAACNRRRPVSMSSQRAGSSIPLSQQY